MLRTASSLPLTGLLTLGFDPARFQTRPPACYRASWQLPGPDFHRQATTSLRTQTTTTRYVTWSPPVPLGARKREARQSSSSVTLLARHALCFQSMSGVMPVRRIQLRSMLLTAWFLMLALSLSAAVRRA
jgi:hypothetical protein